MIKYESNSTLVKPGQVFVAIKGLNHDGHDYIEDAINKGASEVVVEKYVESPKKMLWVADTKEYLADRLTREHGNEVNEMKIIGVTGTNGKTTTCFLVYQMLKQLGKNVAYIGTIGFYHNDFKRELPNTTPDVLELYKLLLEAKEAGAEYIVMEVSSHALELNRIAGLKFELAGFTNLTQDHLDFHQTMEEYLNAKLKIINYLKRDGKMIINSDDENYDAFKKRIKSLTIGTKGDYEILSYKSELDKTAIKFNYLGEERKIQTNLIGAFNVYNYMMALALVNNLGFSIDDIISKTNVYAPKGRLETIKVGESLAVIDYAHTPDATLKAITTCRELTDARIITIIGCGGDRDPKKRSIMGNIATDKSDFVIFTNDNPRTEDPTNIMNDMIRNNRSTNYKTIYNRAEAITEGLNMLNPNDILVILGKGHENYQIIGNVKHHFDDAEQVQLYLKNKAIQ